MRDTFYSASEVSGGRDNRDILYSHEEIETMKDLFSDFYDQNYSFYQEDAERAYADFYDAYSDFMYLDAEPSAEDAEANAETIKNEKANNSANKAFFGPRATRAVAAVGGAGVGFGASHLLTKGLRQKRDVLVEKAKSGMANRKDLEELDKLNSKIKRIKAISTVGGAAAGYGGVELASYIKKRKK